MVLHTMRSSGEIRPPEAIRVADIDLAGALLRPRHFRSKVSQHDESHLASEASWLSQTRPARRTWTRRVASVQVVHRWSHLVQVVLVGQCWAAAATSSFNHRERELKRGRSRRCQSSEKSSEERDTYESKIESAQTFTECIPVHVDRNCILSSAAPRTDS